jgi:hypothetical protein
MVWDFQDLELALPCLPAPQQHQPGKGVRWPEEVLLLPSTMDHGSTHDACQHNLIAMTRNVLLHADLHPQQGWQARVKVETVKVVATSPLL